MNQINGWGMQANRRERIVVLHVPEPRSFRLELQPSSLSRTAISVRLTCNDKRDERCANAVADAPVGARLDISTTRMNERLYVILDSDTDTGFTFTITPKDCGDGLLAADEACDDGNRMAGDGCDGLCELEPACAVTEGAVDSTLTSPATLPDCRTVRFSGRITPPMMMADRDDAARMLLRAGERVSYQVSAGPQGSCPSGIDPVLEVSRGLVALTPMMRNNRCVQDAPPLCLDDARTYCPEGRFVAPTDGWYTFRVYAWEDAGAAYNYQLLLTRR